MASAVAKCKCIMLKADGTKQELAVDMNPGWELKLIGGPVTIIGMFEAIDAIVLGIDQDDMDEAELKKIPTNKHILPAPLNDPNLKGDLVLFRNDDSADPVDLTMAEWTEFCENPEAEKYLKAIELHRQREEDEEEDEDDDEEDDEGDEDDEEDDEEGDEDDEEEDEEPSPKKKAPAPPAGEKGAKRAKA